MKSLNNLTNNSLSIGQTLKVSSGKEEPSKPEVDTNDIYYTVKSGDSLYQIANKYNTTVDEIKRLNNLTNNLLSIGQKLLIKKGAASSEGETVYIVKAGDTLYGIANKYGMSVDQLKTLNNLVNNNLSIGQKLLISGAPVEKITYTVQPGDSLYRIAIKFNTTVDAIKSLNNLNNNLLSIGQKLLIP